MGGWVGGWVGLTATWHSWGVCLKLSIVPRTKAITERKMQALRRKETKRAVYEYSGSSKVRKSCARRERRSCVGRWVGGWQWNGLEWEETSSHSIQTKHVQGIHSFRFHVYVRTCRRRLWWRWWGW